MTDTAKNAVGGCADITHSLVCVRACLLARVCEATTNASAGVFQGKQNERQATKITSPSARVREARALNKGNQHTLIIRALARLDPLVLLPAGDEVRVLSQVLPQQLNVVAVEFSFVVGDARLALLDLVLNYLLQACVPTLRALSSEGGRSADGSTSTTLQVRTASTHARTHTHTPTTLPQPPTPPPGQRKSLGRRFQHCRKNEEEEDRQQS
jgi:hypothetical protein